jgi:HAD superfamily hydrolase (TIGR01509 family)
MTHIFFDLWNTLYYCPTRDRVEDIVRLIGSPENDYGVVRELMDQTIFMDSAKNFTDLIAKIPGIKQSDAAVLGPAARKIWDSRLDGIRPFPEAQEVLQDLSQTHTLGLISNTDQSGRDYFQKSPIREYFTHIITSCDVHMTKPSRQIFEKALELAKATPEDAIMVGDNQINDAQAPKKIGWKGIWLDRTRKENNTRDMIIKDLKGLYEMIK